MKKYLIAAAAMTIQEWIDSGMEFTTENIQDLEALEIDEVIRIGLFDVKRVE